MSVAVIQWWIKERDMNKDDWEAFYRASEYGPKKVEKAPDYRVVSNGETQSKKRSWLSLFKRKGKK